MRERQWTAHQKAGQIAVFLVQGSRLTTVEVARLTGMTYQGALFMMEMLSMVLPIELGDQQWHWIEKEEEN